MRFYSAAELREAADLDFLVSALKEGHTRPKPEVNDGLIGPENARYLIRSAHDGGKLIGTKLVTIRPDNPAARGLPAVQALIVLFDGQDGAPKAALDATELTYWKTAADSALGSRVLSRPDSKTLLVVGAGGLAPWLARGHFGVRPGISEVSIWNRTPGKAEALADHLAKEGFPAQPVGDLETAVRRADIVTTATMAVEPVVKGAWLKPGAHVDLVGGYSPDTREADDEVLERGTLFVDCLESALDGVGDVLAPMAAGLIAKDDIRGDLFDLVGGRIEARTGEDQITVFKNAGGAHLDLMVASALIDRIEGAA